MSAQVCTRCVMSAAADPNITFDENGHCNYCTAALKLKPAVYFPNDEGRQKTDAMVSALKEYGKDKPYDCLMGISGGLDSAYLAYLGTVKWKLRIAAVHVDDGFNTGVTKRNLRRLADACGFTLEVITPNGAQFASLLKAYMLAGVPNLAVPQDNVLTTCLYDYAKKNGVNHFLSGTNYALECILQSGNTHDAFDTVNIKAINKQFGAGSIKDLPMMSQWGRYMDRLRMKVREYRPLDWTCYNAKASMQELTDFCGFEYYGSKHLENSFTAFLQLYWLPQKFGVDKRRSHLSSMIASGQMSRDEALEILAAPAANTELVQAMVSDVKEKLGFSDDEFAAVMAAPTHLHTDYKTDAVFKGVINTWLKIKGV